jgi:hypothetical protein
MIDTPGPVSAALEASLKHLVVQHGVVLWPDRAGTFKDFVDALLARQQAGRLAFAVVAYHGSFLELMFDLESRAGGVTRPPLLIHLPGFDEQAARGTPLLELIEVGHCFSKPLADIVAEAAAEKVPPEAIAALCARPDLTLGDADAWLAMRLAGQHAGVLGQLHGLRLPTVVDDLLRGDGPFSQLAAEPAGQAALCSYMAARAGLTDAWRDASLPSATVRAGDLAFAAASWALAVEYVHDLTDREPADERLRAMGGLPRPVVAACRELAVHLRARTDDFYRRTADETERRLATEVEQARAEDLGEIDTFRFEEEKVLAAALAALAEQQWDTAATWADLRLAGPSFWLRIEPPRQLAWELVLDVARLGQAIAAAGPRLGELYGQPRGRASPATPTTAPPSTAPTATSSAAAAPSPPPHPTSNASASASTPPATCGRLGRRLGPRLQRPLPHPRLPPAPRAAAAHAVRRGRPTTGPTRQARPCCSWSTPSASRWPQELFASFDADTGTTAHLRARLAELPDRHRGRHERARPGRHRGRPPAPDRRRQASIKGFHTGEYTRRRPRDPPADDARPRRRPRGARGSPSTRSSTAPPTRSRKAIRGANLVVVHSREIDNLGEADTAFVSLACLRRPCSTACAPPGTLLPRGRVRRFVITADHGFLLLDDPTRVRPTAARSTRASAVFARPGRRVDHSGEVRVPLADLAYDEHIAPARHARGDRQVFDTSQRPSFVHGGNSPAGARDPGAHPQSTAAAGGGSLAVYRVTVVAPRGHQRHALPQAEGRARRPGRARLRRPHRARARAARPPRPPTSPSSCSRPAAAPASTAPRDAQHIFESLRKGLVPERGIEAFAVGIERQRGRAAPPARARRRGEGTIKFLRGGYGCGKTFMARLALLDAQAKGFASSFVVVSDNDLRFHRFDDVYRKVMTELGTASCPRGALGDILDRWIGRHRGPP